MSDAFEPYSHAHKQDPYSAYRDLRDVEPVYCAPDSKSWVLSRFDDVEWMLRTPELFSSKVRRFASPDGRARSSLRDRLKLGFRFVVQLRALPRAFTRSRMLIQEDGAVHAPMRALVNRGFTPRRIASWEPRIREIVAASLERLPREGSFDLMREVAVPLPVTVIAEMLGVDSERHADFKRWSDAIVEGGTGSGGAGEAATRMLAAMGELRRYLRPLVRARRREPGDDLLSVIVVAEQGDVALSDFEVFMFVMLLLVAGNETTTNLLGNAVDALLAHPGQLERVSADPSRVPALVEEALRFDTPVQFVTRRATRDVERHGETIPRGALVVGLLGSANRDERRFAHPDRFDTERDTRGHLAFGLGPHFCLGASLARLEATLALEALAPLLPRLRRVRPEVDFLDSYQVRGRAKLELEWRGSKGN